MVVHRLHTAQGVGSNPTITTKQCVGAREAQGNGLQNRKAVGSNPTRHSNQGSVAESGLLHMLKTSTEKTL